MAANVSYDFKGKRALVTGAGRGIGRAIAIALAKAGAETYAIDRTQKDLDDLVKEVPAIKQVWLELRDWSDTQSVVASLGKIDLLVNNAAILQLAPIADARPEEFDQSFEVNVKAVLNVSQVVAKGLIAKNSPGAIVNISSQESSRAVNYHGIYGATKGALDQLTKIMALELGPHKIRVNSVNPTVVLTEMGKMFFNDPSRAEKMKARIPLRRFAEVSEVVNPVLYLLSDGASMIHGTILMVDGGFQVA
jgi:L-xylulose reductase